MSLPKLQVSTNIDSGIAHDSGLSFEQLNASTPVDSSAILLGYNPTTKKMGRAPAVVPTTIYDQSSVSFNKGFVMTGTRYPDFSKTSLTNAERGFDMLTVTGKTQIQFIKATLFTNKASTVGPTTLQMFVNNSSIGSITIPVNSMTGVLTTFTGNPYASGSLFSYEFTAVGESDMVCQLYVESQDI